MNLSPLAPGKSLATKVLLGLVLNVVLVGAVFTAVLVLQVRLDPGWLLLGRAGERLRSIADMMSSDLQRGGPADFPEIVQRYRDVYQLDFMLFDATARDVAFATNIPPPPVAQALLRPRADFPARNPAPGRRTNLRQRRQGSDSSPFVEPLPDDLTDPTPDPRSRPNPGRRPFRTPPFPRTVLHAGTPPAYWILLPLPPTPREPGVPLTLVVRTSSLWSGGFLLDPQPWILAGTGALLLSALFWLPLVRGVTRDLGRITTRTEEIAAGHLDRRLDLQRNDELGRLAEAIDQMAARLSHHVAGQKRFLGDAAHELSSPLARLQTIAAILESRPASDHPAYLRDLHEELDQMTVLVDELLAFSRAMHGRPARLQSVPLRDLVDRAWAREGRPEVPYENHVAAGISVLADPHLLQRAISNLLRNAVRYAGHEGPIEIQAFKEGTETRIVLSDSGPGVAPEALPRLFEPFFRPEDSRARELGGTGLGLAIVKTCIEGCRGTVSARNRSPAGFEVTLRIPAG